MLFHVSEVSNDVPGGLTFRAVAGCSYRLVIFTADTLSLQYFEPRITMK